MALVSWWLPQPPFWTMTSSPPPGPGCCLTVSQSGNQRPWSPEMSRVLAPIPSSSSQKSSLSSSPFIQFFLSSLPIPANRWMPSGPALSTLSGGQPKRPLSCLSLAACLELRTEVDITQQINAHVWCVRWEGCGGSGPVAADHDETLRAHVAQPQLVQNDSAFLLSLGAVGRDLASTCWPSLRRDLSD